MGNLTPKILELVARLSGGDPAPTVVPASRSSLGPGSPDFAETVARLLGMPLERFAREGCPLEVRVPWLEVTIWFVPSEADAGALAQEGVSRGRIWTARELMDLLSIPGLTKEQARMVALAKVEFAGEVVEVRGSATVADPEGIDGWHQGGDLMDPLGGTIDAEPY